MCFEDLMVVRGRLRGRVTTLAAVTAFVGIGLGGCGGDEDPAQTTAPAETGASEPTADSTTSSSTDATEPPGEPSADPEDDEAEIVTALEAILVGDDPASACGEAVTERFLRRAYGDAAGCEAALKSAKPATDAGVTQVVIHPDSVAQALARPQGGIYDGQKLRAELVLHDGAWKLDSLRSNVPVGP